MLPTASPKTTRPVLPRARTPTSRNIADAEQSDGFRCAFEHTRFTSHREREKQQRERETKFVQRHTRRLGNLPARAVGCDGLSRLSVSVSTAVQSKRKCYEKRRSNKQKREKRTSENKTAEQQQARQRQTQCVKVCVK